MAGRRPQSPEAGEWQLERRRLLTEELARHLIDDLLDLVQQYAEQQEILVMNDHLRTMSYNAAEGDWTVLKTALHSESMALKGEIYLAGPLSSVYRLGDGPRDSKSWMALSPARDGVSSGGLGCPLRVVAGKAIHHIGWGLHWSWAPATEWQKHPQGISLMSRGQVVAFGQTIYALDNSGFKAYDCENETSRPVSNPKLMRVEAAAAGLDGFLYFCGGFGVGSHSLFEPPDPQCEVYNTATDRWHPIASPRTHRTGAVAVSVDGRIFLCGGQTAFPTTWVSSVECYCPRSACWSDAAPMPCAPQRPTAIVL